MSQKSKVEKRRDMKIEEAVQNNDWETVLHLLEQPLENLQRQDREYQLSSLNKLIATEERTTEVLDLYPDDTYNPLKKLLIDERNEYLMNALEKLSAEDLYIFLSIVLCGKSALQLTKETRFKSHKTIQRHYENSKKILKEELKKYF